MEAAVGQPLVPKSAAEEVENLLASRRPSMRFRSNLAHEHEVKL